MRMQKTLKALLFLVLSGSICISYAPKIASAAAGGLTTQDYLDIEQTYARYYHAIDSGDAEGWADTFTDDGDFNGTKGRAALLEARRKGGPSKLRHIVSNLVIKPTAQGVDGSLYVILIDPTADPIKILSYSRYDDTLVKTAKGWRFKTKMRSSDTSMKPGVPPPPP